MNGIPSTGYWAVDVTLYTSAAISALGSLLSLAALLSCALQKPSSFHAVGPLGKGAWLAILAGSILLSALGVAESRGDSLGLFGLIAMIASLVYLLDIRPAIRDLGSNSW